MNASTFTDLMARYPGERKKIWSTRALMSRNRTSIFEKAVGGEGSGKPIIRKNDLNATQGDKITFTTMAALGGRARRGSQTLRGNEEKVKRNTFDMQVDFLRHAVALDKKIKKVAAIKMDYELSGLLGDHCAWQMDDDLAMMYRLRAIAKNRLYGGGVGSEDQLLSAHVLTGSLIEEAGEVARGRNAKGVKVITSAQGGELQKYVLFLPHYLLANFRRTSEWRDGIQHAGPKSEENPLFTGEYYDWCGHIIAPFEAGDTDSDGPVGSAWTPKAFLGDAIAAGSGALTITGGGSAVAADLTGPLYFGYFSNYDWKFTEDQGTTTFVTTKYAAIYNLTDSGGDSPVGDIGKFGVISYINGNNGNSIALTNRLGNFSTGTGNIYLTTLAGQTWDPTKHTLAHPEGATIVQVNAKCVPIAHFVLSGQESAFRGDGMDTIQPTNQAEDYGWVQGTGYEACYGQCVKLDTNLEPRGYVFVTCAVTYPGLTNLPNVTS